MTRTTDLVLLFALALVLGACGGGVIKPSAFDRANGHLDEGRPLEAVQEYRVALNENPGRLPPPLQHRERLPRRLPRRARTR